MCYAAVSFGSFRDYAFVPRFLWKNKDIAMLDEARVFVEKVFRPTDVQAEWGLAGSKGTSWTRTSNSDSLIGSSNAGEENEDDGNNATEGSEDTIEAERLISGIDVKAAPSSSCLDRLLEQLVLPKVRLQYQQLLAARSASARLRSRRGRQDARTSQANSEGLVHAAPSNAPLCWKYLDMAKRQHQYQNCQGKESASLFPSSVAVYDTNGSALAAFNLLQRSAGLSSSGNRLTYPVVRQPGNALQIDSLVTAIAYSLRFHQAPQALKTALLPEGARPSMWGLPASVLLMRHTPQQPPLSALKQSGLCSQSARQAPSTSLGRLLLQCSNSCCRVVVGFVKDLQHITRDTLPVGGATWANIGLKYLLEELSSGPTTATEERNLKCKSYERREAGGILSGEQTTEQSRYTLQATVVEWMQEEGLLDASAAAKLRDESYFLKPPELWAFDAEKTSQKSWRECGKCSKDTEVTRSSDQQCTNWSCVLRRDFSNHLVPLLDDEKASWARLKLESRLLISPSTVAFVCTYMQPLLRTRRRLQELLRTKQEESFQSQSDPATIARMNRIKQQQSHAVDSFVGWVLCGGPVRHVVGFHVFQFRLFTPDSLIDIAGHADAQRVYFWRLASSNSVPRAPQNFLEGPTAGPLLSFGEALAMGKRHKPHRKDRQGDRTSNSHTIFLPAARYINNYEKGVLSKDLETSITFVDHLTELIARRCRRSAEKLHVHNSEKYQKLSVESWDPSPSNSRNATNLQNIYGHHHPSEHHPKDHFSSHQRIQLRFGLQDMLKAASPQLQESLMPSDLFDWQQHLVEQQNRSIMKEVEVAYRAASKEGLEGVSVFKELEEKQPTTWRWAPDEDDLMEQRSALEVALKKREAEEEARRLQEAKARRKRLEEEALSALDNRFDPSPI